MRISSYVIFGFALLVAGCGDRDQAGPAPSGDLPALELALRPSAVGEFHRLPPTPIIAIEAQLNPARDALSGRQRLWYPNRTGAALTTIALRCPANAPAFRGASLTIANVRWNGVTLSPPVVTTDRTGYTWTLPKPLAAGALGMMELSFTATCSTTGGFHGLLSRAADRWCLYHWHPELAAWRNGAWSLPTVTGMGDESQVPLAHLTLQLTVPTGTQVISGGAAATPLATQSGWEMVAVSAPSTRNLALALATDLRSVEQNVNGVRVRSWATPDHPNSNLRALKIAADSLALYDRTFGSYPFKNLEIVETTHGDDVGGMESTGLIFIDSKSYAASEFEPATTTVESLPVLEMSTAVAHEVAHQWWYSIVGNDSFYDPWLDESLTNWTCAWALESLYGLKGRTNSLNLNYAGVVSHDAGKTAAIDAPLANFKAMDDYGATVYARGVLMYETLRLRLGDQRFLAWLRRWQTEHRFGIATPKDWRAALDRELGVSESAAFCAQWLHASGLTQAHLQWPLSQKPKP